MDVGQLVDLSELSAMHNIFVNYYSLTNLFLSVWIQLIPLFPELMHSNYVQYSTVRFCAVLEDR